MTLQEAITYDKDLKAGLDLPLMRQHAKALDLSIEALQLIREFRKTNNRDILWHLPSETKE